MPTKKNIRTKALNVASPKKKVAVASVKKTAVVEKPNKPVAAEKPKKRVAVTHALKTRIQTAEGWKRSRMKESVRPVKQVRSK